MPAPETEKISVQCTCGKRLKAPAPAVGKKAKCPACGNMLIIEAPPEDDSLGALYDLAEQADAAATKPQAATVDNSPRCPQCMSPMAAGAVLCTNCGFDTRSGKKIVTKKESARPLAALASGKSKPKDKLAPQGSFWIGLAVCAGFAIAGSLVWFLIGWGTGYEIGFVAMGVGALAGIGMQIGQKGYSTLGGAVAAVMTLLAIVIAKIAIFITVLVPMVSKSSAALSAKSDVDEFDPRVVNMLVEENLKAGGVKDPEDASETQYEIAEKSAHAKLKKLSKNEYQALLTKAEQKEADQELLGLVTQDILKQKGVKYDHPYYMDEYKAAETQARAKVDAMSAQQRTDQVKALRAKAEQDVQNEIAQAKQKAKSSGGSSGSGTAVRTGAFLLILLLIFGWKSIFFVVLGMFFAYRTAAGAVSG